MGIFKNKWNCWNHAVGVLVDWSLKHKPECVGLEDWVQLWIEMVTSKCTSNKGWKHRTGRSITEAKQLRFPEEATKTRLQCWMAKTRVLHQCWWIRLELCRNVDSVSRRLLRGTSRCKNQKGGLVNKCLLSGFSAQPHVSNIKDCFPNIFSDKVNFGQFKTDTIPAVLSYLFHQTSQIIYPSLTVVLIGVYSLSVVDLRSGACKTSLPSSYWSASWWKWKCRTKWQCPLLMHGALLEYSLWYTGLAKGLPAGRQERTGDR